jgi:2-polyprenyl-3-methyl-5-hydroxy-6-metoxy-1,4-benzoquinol methylase
MSRVKQALKRVGLFILWPVRRFFDPRFEGIAAAMQANIHATTEATEMLGRSLDELQARVDARLEEQQRQIEATRVDVEATRVEVEATRVEVEATREEAAHASGRYFERLVGGSVREIDQSVAHLLNYAASHRGFAAQRDLWLNPPVSLAYEPGGVRLTNVNERIVEIPHVYRALARVEPGGRIADVGAVESLVALSLAMLGYDVTAVDLRPYPFKHPRLRSVTSPVEEWNEENEMFDAIVCLSTIEHVGLGAYGEDAKDGRADIAAMKRMRELVKPGGLLVLTTRFGTAGEDEFQRTYDRAGLEELLEGWKVDELAILRRDGDTSWSLADGSADAEDGAEKVALVTATRA